MGEGIEYICRDCGFRNEICYGPGFLSSPRNPETRERALNGKYGPRPRKVLEAHPEADCSWYRPLFHCSCGNLSAKDAVIITDEDRILYRPSMRCNICHRRMWEIIEPPRFAPCPRCGSMMRCDVTVLWD